MEIALYTDHNELPFGQSPTQPNEMFDPKRHRNRELTFVCSEATVEESWIWPVLMGLHAITLPVMAHVSAFRPLLGDNKWAYSKRVWVQITTLPIEVHDDFPLIIKDGTVTVAHLWGGNNNTADPYDFLEGKVIEGSSEPAFWQNFFTEKLYEEKMEAELAARKAAAVARRYAAIPI